MDPAPDEPRSGGDVPEKSVDAGGEQMHARLIEVTGNVDQLQRHLGIRQIQLIAIGGAIGTALFVSIGGGLMEGGPASLLIAYVLYSCLLGLVSSSLAEMVIYMPVSGSFIRMAGKWVDDAFGFMAGWNFFLYEACLIPYEISALNLVLTFWRDDIPPGAVCAACIVLYAYVIIPYPTPSPPADPPAQGLQRRRRAVLRRGRVLALQRQAAPDADALRLHLHHHGRG